MFLAANSMEVGMLVTDRHKQINKFLNKKYPEIEHRYDVWHVSKGKLCNQHIVFLMYLQLLRIEEEVGQAVPVQGL